MRAAVNSRVAESMGDHVETATFEILRGIQASTIQVLPRFHRLEARMSHFETRREGLETGMRKDRCNAAGMRVTMRATAGDFYARVSEVEERVAALASRTG